LVHVPGSAVSVCPVICFPLIVGCAVFCGAAAEAEPARAPLIAIASAIGKSLLIW
jgi:hypothetical protein